MTAVKWTNYFVESTMAKATDGHIPAESLRRVIKDWRGGEAYHCAYDLEARDTFKDYVGLMRPALDHVWFDFDSHDGGQKALENTRAFLQWLEIPDAFICYSGSKGFHVGVPFSYFGRDPSPDLCSTLNRLATTLKARYPTLDTTIYNANRKFRALGSKHPKTGLYKITLPKELLGASLDVIKGLAKNRGDLAIPIPERRLPLQKLVDLISAPTPPKEKLKRDRNFNAPEGTAAFAKCSFLTHARDDAPILPEPEWYAALSVVSRFKEGRKKCHEISHKHPGYSVSETNKKIDQALEESGPRTCENIATMWEGCARCPLQGRITSPVAIYDTRFWTLGERGTLIPLYNELLEEFCSQHPYKTIADMKTVYLFKETHYVEYTPIEIKNFAEEHFHPKPKESNRQEFTHKIFANHVERRTFFSQGTEGKINFRNGVLSIDSQTLSPHSQDYGFRNVLPYDYNPTEPCPVFEWWINDVMLGDKELIAILQEFMGYVIRGGEYKYHKALWLSGTGRNGKSTFLDVLKALIGHDNYSALSIKSISQDKFSSADLDGKIANFSEETSPEELSDSSQFKNLTGDGDVNAQKKYGDPYKFRNRAKLIMTYNEVPELRDLSPGMLSRPIIIPWEKDLSADELQDKGLKAKLLKELPGIFNYALAGWKRLEEQGQFTYSAKSDAAKTTLREASCSALQWVENYVLFLPIDSNSSNREIRSPLELFEAYREVEGRYAYKAVKFFRRINEHPQIKKRRRRPEKGTEYFSMIIKPRASYAALKSDLTGSARIIQDLPAVEY